MSSRPLRVLVAEDNERARRSLCAFLRMEGIDVVCEAVDGAEAVKKTRQFKPDVVLLDIGMPKLNGFVAARLIKKELPSTRIIIVSQHNSPAFARESLTAGAVAYVLKENASRDLLPWLEDMQDEKRVS
jgi:DNA-binding NarL/FixJ family response regulator